MTSSASWNATPIFSPNPVTVATTSGRQPANIAPNRADVAMSDAGLVRQHLQVVGDPVVLGPRADRLVQLAEAQPLERGGLDADRVGPEPGHRGRRAREQQVPREDGDRVAPDLVRRRGAAAQRRGVHDVVVVERGQVRELDDDRGVDHLPPRPVAQLGREQGQQRAQPLAAGVDQVARRVVRQGVHVGHRVPQTLLDQREPHGQPVGQIGIGQREGRQGSHG